MTVAFRHVLDWPVHSVRVRLTLVHPRKLRPLEWAVLRWLEQWTADARPSMDELAHALFVDVAFLEDALDDTSRLGAVVRSEDGELALSERGRELFRRGLIEGEPSWHDVELAIDGVTDRDLSPSVLAASAHHATAPALDVLPRAAIGLDRVRDAVAKHLPEELGEGGEIRDAQLLAASLHWRPTTVEGHLADGALRLVAELDEEAFAMLAELPTAIPDRARGDAQRAEPIQRAPLEAARDDDEVLSAIRAARHEILATASWQRDPRFREALDDASRRGLRVVFESSRAEVDVDREAFEPMLLDGRVGFRELHVLLRCGTALRLLQQLDADEVATARRAFLSRHLPWIAALEACASEERLALAWTAESLAGHPAAWIRQLVVPSSPTIAQVLSAFELPLDDPPGTSWLEARLRSASPGQLTFADLLRASASLELARMEGPAAIVRAHAARAPFDLDRLEDELAAIAELVPPDQRAKHVIERAKAGSIALLEVKANDPVRWAALRARIEKLGVPGIALDAVLVAAAAPRPHVHGTKKKRKKVRR